MHCNYHLGQIYETGELKKEILPPSPLSIPGKNVYLSNDCIVSIANPNT